MLRCGSSRGLGTPSLVSGRDFGFDTQDARGELAEGAQERDSSSQCVEVVYVGSHGNGHILRRVSL